MRPKLRALGRLLETWINQSRATSINGALPIPSRIRAALTAYIDKDSLDRAKYKVGDAGALNLGGLSLKYGDFPRWRRSGYHAERCDRLSKRRRCSSYNAGLWAP